MWFLICRLNDERVEALKELELNDGGENGWGVEYFGLHGEFS